jgi:hypothetical protein
MIVLTTAAAILALESTATGFVIGWATALILRDTGESSMPNAALTMRIPATIAPTMPITMA